MITTKRILFALISLTLLWMVSCQMDRPAAGEKEAWEDQAEFDEARSYQDNIPAGVYATVESDPMPERVGDDAADDPAVWIHPTHPEMSLILGTNKKGGLAVYNLEGKEVAYLSLIHI
jgi:3-phytase